MSGPYPSWPQGQPAPPGEMDGRQQRSEMTFSPNYQANPATSPPPDSVAATASPSWFPTGSPQHLLLPSPQPGEQAAFGSMDAGGSMPGNAPVPAQGSYPPGQQLLLPPPEIYSQQQYPTQHLESSQSYPSNGSADFGQFGPTASGAPPPYSAASPSAFQPVLQLPHPGEVPTSQPNSQGAWAAAPVTMPLAASGFAQPPLPPLFLPQPEQSPFDQPNYSSADGTACAAAGAAPGVPSLVLSPTAKSPERTSSLAAQNPTAASPPPTSAVAAACRDVGKGESPGAGRPSEWANAGPQHAGSSVGPTPAMDCGDGTVGRSADQMGGDRQGSPRLPPLAQASGSPINYHVPSEEDTDHMKAQMGLRDARQHTIIYVLGLLAFFGATSLVVVIALTMLFDQSYVFWMGGSTPTLLVALASSTFLLFAVLGMIWLRCVNMDRLSRWGSCAVGTSVALCSIGLGVGLLLLVSRGNTKLVAMTEAVATGCFQANAPSELAQLSKTAEALHELRTTRACSRNLHTSVEECSNFEETKYSMYLRYLEQQLGCNSICPEVGSPHTAQLKLSPSLLQGSRSGLEASRLMKARRLKTRVARHRGGRRGKFLGRGQGQALAQALSIDAKISPGGDQEASPSNEEASEQTSEDVPAEEESEGEDEDELEEEDDDDRDPAAWAASSTAASYSDEQEARLAPLDSEHALSPGDAVFLSDDLFTVKQAFHGEYCLTWDEKMEPMLGKMHRVMSVLEPSKCGKSIGVRSPDGSQEGIWYFPAALFVRATLPSSRAHSNWLFSRSQAPGRVCYPMMASQLQGSAFLLGSGMWLHGWLLVSGGILSFLLGIYATVMNKIS